MHINLFSIKLVLINQCWHFFSIYNNIYMTAVIYGLFPHTYFYFLRNEYLLYYLPTVFLIILNVIFSVWEDSVNLCPPACVSESLNKENVPSGIVRNYILFVGKTTVKSVVLLHRSATEDIHRRAKFNKSYLRNAYLLF